MFYLVNLILKIKFMFLFKLCVDWTVDYELYEWKKLNPDNENDKKLVNNMFMWEGDIKGKKFNQGKIFK